jgi:hypothetical protein
MALSPQLEATLSKLESLADVLKEYTEEVRNRQCAPVDIMDPVRGVAHEIIEHSTRLEYHTQAELGGPIVQPPHRTYKVRFLYLKFGQQWSTPTYTVMARGRRAAIEKTWRELGRDIRDAHVRTEVEGPI